MKTKSAGIIAEYNPFHNGHLYHVEETRRRGGAEIVIAAMSGNFLQRGVMAVADKWLRAEAAVMCGVDLAVEIPAVFACASAKTFAEAGVEILENLGADHISFGSESGNIEELSRIARAIKEHAREIQEHIDRMIKAGVSYPRARREAVCTLIGESSARALDSPNNILAIEYISAAKRAKPMTIERTGPGYNDMSASGNLASATAIRELMARREDISRLLPGKSYEALLRADVPSEEKFFDMIRQKVLMTEGPILDNAPAGGEGLGNKLKNSIRMCSDREQLAQMLKSKRYTRTRIDRFLAQTVLCMDRREYAANYIRVLAFNDRGREYLKEIKKSDICCLPVITNINKEATGYPQIAYSLSRDILAADLYNMAAGRDMYRFSEYVRKPFCMD